MVEPRLPTGDAERDRKARRNERLPRHLARPTFELVKRLRSKFCRPNHHATRGAEMQVGFVKGAARGSEGHASFDRARVVAPERLQLVDDEPLETGSGDDERVILRSRA